MGNFVFCMQLAEYREEVASATLQSFQLPSHFKTMSREKGVAVEDSTALIGYFEALRAGKSHWLVMRSRAHLWDSSIRFVYL